MSHPSPRRKGAEKPRRLRLPNSTRLRWTLLGIGLATVVGSPLAVGAISQHPSIVAGTKTPITGVIFKPTTLATNTPSFGFNVTNASNRGGASLLTCRALAGNNRNSCLRSVNTANGPAFQFGFKGSLGGLMLVGNDIGKQFPDAQPFVTNATGVATGLNADRVDGMHAQDIIDTAVAKSSVQVGPQGPQGTPGAQGSRGPQGAQGQSGPPGTPLFDAKSTGPNSSYGNRTVADLRNEPLASQQPVTNADGNDLLPGRALDPLNPGTYIVQTTFRAFDLGMEGPDPTLQYGVAAVFLDGQRIATLWTSDIPADGNNAATASDTTVIGVPSGAAGILEVRGVVRQNATATGGSTAEGGVTVVVTEVNAG